MKRSGLLVFVSVALMLIGGASAVFLEADTERYDHVRGDDALPIDWARADIRPYVIPEIDITFEYPKQWSGPRIEWLQTGKAYFFTKFDMDVFRLSHELYYPQQLNSVATVDQLASFLKQDMPNVDQQILTMGGLDWVRTYGKDDAGSFVQYIALRNMGEQGNILSVRVYVQSVDEAVAEKIVASITAN